jgi:hypothetical protein
VTKDTKQPGKWAKTRKAAWLISAGYVKSQYECDMIFTRFARRGVLALKPGF